jgi:lipopolysaccharide export system permease protein
MTSTQLKQMIDDKERKGEVVSPSLKIRYLRRFSQPLACLLLIFAALPLCVATPRRRSYWSLAYIGAVVAGFFITVQISLSLGDNGKIPPLLAAWLPGLMPVVVGFSTFFVARSRN